MKFVPFCTHPGFRGPTTSGLKFSKQPRKKKVSADDGATWRPWGPTLSRVHERSFLDESTMAWQGVTRGKNPQLPLKDGFEMISADNSQCWGQCGEWEPALFRIWKLGFWRQSVLEPWKSHWMFWFGIDQGCIRGAVVEARCCQCNWTRLWVEQFWWPRQRWWNCQGWHSND